MMMIGVGGLLFLIVAVAVILWIGPYEAGERRSDPLSTLEKRYARGEISRDEYMRQKGELGG